MATRRWRGAGDEGGLLLRRDLRELIVAAGVAAPATALGAWILLTPAMCSGTARAAFALARTARRTILIAGSSIAVGAVTAAALVRRLRTLVAAT